MQDTVVNQTEASLAQHWLTDLPPQIYSPVAARYNGDVYKYVVCTANRANTDW